MKPPRTPWHHFPDVFIHAQESAVKQHAAYAAAKSGDTDSAAQLVAATLNLGQVQALSNWVRATGCVDVTLVSAHAYESQGINAIPQALADALSAELGWRVENAVLQANVVSHTGADGWSRLSDCTN
jgi:hypothetical protein